MPRFAIAKSQPRIPEPVMDRPPYRIPVKSPRDCKGRWNHFNQTVGHSQRVVESEPLEPFQKGEIVRFLPVEWLNQSVFDCQTMPMRITRNGLDCRRIPLHNVRSFCKTIRVARRVLIQA